MENKSLQKITLNEGLLNMVYTNVGTIHSIARLIRKEICNEIKFAKSEIADVTESAMVDFSSEEVSLDEYFAKYENIAKMSTQFTRDVSDKYTTYMKQLAALISSFIDDVSDERIPTDSPEDANAAQLDEQDDAIFEEGGAPSARRISAVRFSTKDGLCGVYVRYDDDGEEEKLFDFFIDEISFSAEELIGLTEEEADALKCRKDKEYDDLSV